MSRPARLALVGLGALVTAATLAACGGGAPSPVETATDAQVAYYDAYSDSPAPEAFGGTFEQAIDLGDAACSDLDDGMSVAGVLGGADPATLDASKAVVAAAGTYLCPAHAEAVSILSTTDTEGN